MATEKYKYEDIPLMTDEYVISCFDQTNKSDDIERDPRTLLIVLTNKRIIEANTVDAYRNYTFGDLRDSHTISIKKKRKPLTHLLRACLLIFTSIVSVLILGASLPVYAMALLFISGSTYHFIRFICSPKQSQITMRSTTSNLEMVFPRSREQSAYIFVNNLFEAKAHLSTNINHPNTMENPESPPYNQSDIQNESKSLPVNEQVVDQNTPEEKRGD